MKTRMLAMAVERGREGFRSAQACGLVSRMMVRREGGRSTYCLVSLGIEVGFGTGMIW